MESNLTTALNEGLNYKNEVKSIVAMQVGSKYGFLVEIESKLGTFYCPLTAYRSKDSALAKLREEVRK